MLRAAAVFISAVGEGKVKRTKIILHLLTVLTLISAFCLGAAAVISTWGGGWRGYVYGGAASGSLYRYLAIGALLTAILLQIAVIELKIKHGQDAKREKRVVVFIVGMLVLVAGVAFCGYEFAGQVGLAMVPLLALLALTVVFLVGRVRGRAAD